jgi:hypothetical protein
MYHVRDEGEKDNLSQDKKVERKLDHFATKGIHLHDLPVENVQRHCLNSQYFVSLTWKSAELAQLAERTTLNRVVEGSIPSFGDSRFRL